MQAGTIALYNDLGLLSVTDAISLGTRTTCPKMPRIDGHIWKTIEAEKGEEDFYPSKVY